LDLPFYLRVLWRFRVLVAVGLLLALGLAVLSMVRIGPGGVTWRQDEVWVTRSILFVTQQGFPWGYTNPVTADGEGKQQRQQTEAGQDFADPARFSSLAVLYAQLATSDQVRKLIAPPDGFIRDGEIVAAPVLASDNVFAAPLPLIRLEAAHKTPEAARALLFRATKSFRTFLATEQSRNGIPPDQRVLVTVVKKAEKPQLLQGRSTTLPVVVFMSVMILVFGLCFVLENVRRGARPVVAEDAVESLASAARDAA